MTFFGQNVPQRNDQSSLALLFIKLAQTRFGQKVCKINADISSYADSLRYF